MEGRASISGDIVASYAADAAREVPGIVSLVESRLPPHRGVRVSDDDGAVTVDLYVTVAWDASIPDVGRGVQERVRAYLARMANLDPSAVNVTVADVAPPE